VIQILVFLVVTSIIATGGVLVAQWVGILPTPPKPHQFQTVKTGRRPAPPAGIVALVCISMWILVWIVMLIVGIAYISNAS
jgi:hypothetical protein